MRCAVVGTGYVGLTAGASFASVGNSVTCIDRDRKIIERLNCGEISIFEPGLESMVKEATARGDLRFSNDLVGAICVDNPDAIFLAVGTPSREDGEFNLDYVIQAATDVGKALKHSSGFKIIIGKSTVPQGSWKRIHGAVEEGIGKNSCADWAYVANPETLAEGTAVSDFEKPDRVLIGTNDERAFRMMKSLYHPFILKSGDDLILHGTPSEAELAKVGSNAMLAGRIAMINELARIAEVTEDVDMGVVRRMVVSDQRIGVQFMYPSPGYGGSCFPKDVQGMVAQAVLDGYNPILLSRIHESNESHKNHMGERVLRLLEETSNPRIAVWGLTFKPRTDDMREAASIPILTKLINSGAEVVAYDPQPTKAKEIFGNRVKFVDRRYDAVFDADALMHLTEWKEFRALDYNILEHSMKGRLLFDLRNVWNSKAANDAGFSYYGVGINHPLKRN